MDQFFSGYLAADTFIYTDNPQGSVVYKQIKNSKRPQSWEG
jgi:hypothetical protein